LPCNLAVQLCSPLKYFRNLICCKRSHWGEAAKSKCESEPQQKNISENVEKRSGGKCKMPGLVYCHWELSLVWVPWPRNSPEPPTPSTQLPILFSWPQNVPCPLSFGLLAPYMASVVSMCLNTHLFIQIWPEGVCGNRRKHQQLE